MTPTQLKQLDIVRRQAGQYAEAWYARGDFVYSTNDAQVVKIGKFEHVDAAHYVAGMHNLFQVIVNEMILLHRQLADWKRE